MLAEAGVSEAEDEAGGAFGDQYGGGVGVAAGRTGMIVADGGMTVA